MTEKEKELLHRHDTDIGKIGVTMIQAVKSIDHSSRAIESIADRLEEVFSKLGENSVILEKVDSLRGELRGSLKDRDEHRILFEKSVTTRIKELEDDRVQINKDGYRRLYVGLSVSFTAMTFIFLYLYSDIKENHNSFINSERKITKNIINIEKEDSKISRVNIRLKTHISYDKGVR